MMIILLVLLPVVFISLAIFNNRKKVALKPIKVRVKNK